MKLGLVGNTQLVAGGAGAIAAVIEVLKKNSIETIGNPDLYVRTYRSFGIDEARELRDRSALRPVGQRRVFVLAMPEMTREAQNALLKTIEEPPANALFIFILPSPETLLSTVRSRAQRLDVQAKSSTDEAGAFLAAGAQKRLDLLKGLLEKGEDDKRDLGAILAFLGMVETALANRADVDALNALYRARKYVTDKGALVKPLLEQLALLTPRS